MFQQNAWNDIWCSDKCGKACLFIYSLRYTNSDNFSFQNNGIKKCTYWKTMRFFGKQWVFKAMFLTRLHTWFILIIKHMHFIKKTIHVLHKISFYNTMPHRSHSLIGHLIQELWYILLCFALLHSEITSF